MGFLGGLEKLQISAYKDKNFTGVPRKFSVYINPAKYTHTYRIRYNDVQAQGSNGGSPDFNKVLSDIVKFELVFDGTGVVPSPMPGVVPFRGDGIAEQIDAFKKIVFNYVGNIHSTPFLQLTWGTLVFRCRLSTLDVTYTLFKPDGTPLRARANATFFGYTDEAQLARQANESSSDLTHLVTVTAGDTLPLLCHRIYGTSTPYLRVAEFNGLTDFRSLAAGTTLLFPPLSDAAS
jgi:hypothetical protein